MPNHYSIPYILNKNGYCQAFFYGGWLAFQGMHNFLKKQGFQSLNLRFPDKYKAMKKNSDGFAWGYPDGEVMKRSFEVIDSLDKNPMLNIYLTLSTHSPFSIPNREKYKEQIENLIQTNTKIDKSPFMQNNLEPYISVLYADDCLRYLFNGYKNRKDYNNTIFILTGDHTMHEIGIENEMELYHVPLIICSPMLKEKRSFNAVVSHHDIAPSLLNLLSGSQIINTPEIVHWMGYGLETNDDVNRKFLPFIQNNKDIVSCIYSNYFYDNGKLYELLPDRGMKSINNKEVLSKIESRMNNFKLVNQYIMSGQNIVPPYIFYKNF